MDNQEQMRSASVFLHGSYPTEQAEFYRRAIVNKREGRLIIAADGGLMLFASLGLKPDLIVGDFDSVDPTVLQKYNEIEMIRYPERKDATDGELAIRAALERGCDDIELYGAIDTRYETDHLLANLLLLKLARGLMKGPATARSVRAVDHRQHIYLVENEKLQLAGKSGDFVSIIPLNEKITVSIIGVEWELEKREVTMGSTWTLRNRFASSSADIAIAGTALVVHRHS